jgi:hypothetical protein
MLTRVTVSAVVAAVAVLAAGCGGGGGQMSKADYQAKVQADGQAVQDAEKKITSSSSLAQLAQEVTAAEAEAAKAADDLDAITPPSEVAADNDTLVKALRAIDVQLKKLAQAAKDGDQAAAQAAAAAIRNAPEVKAARVAVKDMAKKGYKVGVFGSSGL